MSQKSQNKDENPVGPNDKVVSDLGYFFETLTREFKLLSIN